MILKAPTFLLFAVLLASLQCMAQPAPDILVKPPPGWELLPHTTSGGILAHDAIRSFYPTLAPNEAAPLFFIANSGGFTQISALTLSPNTTYHLTFSSGTRATGNFGGFDFKVDTTSGVVVGEWVGANHNLAPTGTLGDFTRTFTTGPNPPGKGEKLRLSISQPPGVPPNSYTDVANIRFTSGPATTPHRSNCPIDVFIVAGQSNAHGWQADAAKLTPANRHYADAPSPLVLLAYRQRNLPEPLDNIGSMAQLTVQGPGFADNFNGFGPELALGTDVAEASKRPLAIIKYAIGSAGLDVNYKKSLNQLYPSFVSFVATSLQQLRDQGYVPTLKAVFWLQGETDVWGNPGGYGQNIADFAYDLRQDLQAPGLTFFLTEINGHMSMLGGPAQGVAAVNQGMMDFAKKDSRVFFIPTSDITSDFADGIHYSANQQINIGQRWAKAYLDHKDAN